MNKFIALVVLLGIASPVFASDVERVCSNVVLRHDGGLDSIDYQGKPLTRFHVADSSKEDGCPPVNSIVDLEAHFYGDVQGSIDSYHALNASNTVISWKSLTNIKLVGPRQVAWNNEPTNEVLIKEIIPCSGEGAVGSGMSVLCCEGLQALPAVDEATCERLAGGYYCSACGDGICKEELENKCNCPTDCK